METINDRQRDIYKAADRRFSTVGGTKYNISGNTLVVYLAGETRLYRIFKEKMPIWKIANVKPKNHYFFTPIGLL